MGIGWGTPIERPEGSENGNRVARPTRSRCAHIPTPGAPPSGSRGPFLGVWGAASRAITVTEHLPILSISTSNEPSGLERSSIPAAISRVDNEGKSASPGLGGSLQPQGRLRVDSGAIHRVSRPTRRQSSRAFAAISRPARTKSIFLTIGSSRYPPSIIDQVRGVRLGTPRGIDAR